MRMDKWKGVQKRKEREIGHLQLEIIFLKRKTTYDSRVLVSLSNVINLTGNYHDMVLYT